MIEATYVCSTCATKVIVIAYTSEEIHKVQESFNRYFLCKDCERQGYWGDCE